MHDQAQTLRKLVRECVRADAAPPASRPAVLVVIGAQQGVGTTSVARYLTEAFQQLGQASILVDGGATEGIALQAQAEGIQIFAASAENRLLAADADSHRWIAELAHVAPDTEVVVVDGGNGTRSGMQAIWEASEAALLVTTPDPPAVLRVYTLLKLLHSGGPRPLIYCLINRASDATTAGAVFARLHQACRRFLDLDLRPAGFVPQELVLDSGRREPSHFEQLAQPVRERLLRAASALSEGLRSAEAEFPVISCQERFNLEPRSDRYTRTLSVADQPLDFAD